MEKIANWGYLRDTKSSPNTRKVFKRIRRIRGKNLCVHGEDAKRLFTYSPKSPKDIKVYLSRLIIIRMLNSFIFFLYIIWDRLSQKTISRYCPFNYCTKEGEGIKRWSSYFWVLLHNSGFCNGCITKSWSHNSTKVSSTVLHFKFLVRLLRYSTPLLISILKDEWDSLTMRQFFSKK